MRGASVKRWPRVRLRGVSGFVRPIVLALVVSVAGLSSALVICVTSCVDDFARTAQTNAKRSCHDRGHGKNETIGTGHVACTHDPAVLVSQVLSFDTRLPSVVPPSVSSVSPALSLASLDADNTPPVATAYVSHRPSAALRI